MSGINIQINAVKAHQVIAKHRHAKILRMHVKRVYLTGDENIWKSKINKSFI